MSKEKWYVVRALAAMVLCFGLSAVASAEINETAAWQGRIDAASAVGGGRVVVPAGTHVVASLELKSGVTLELSDGATLLASTNRADYLRIENNSKKLAVLYACGATNIAVVGSGRLDGRGDALGYSEEGPDRWRMIHFRDCTGVTVENIRIENSNYWTTFYERCRKVVLRGLVIRSQANFNNDGIDLEVSDALVENCDIDTDDDAVCFKSHAPTFVNERIEVRNCLISSHCNCIKFGTATHGIFRDIDIHDCTLLTRGSPGRRDWTRWPGVDSYDWAISGIAIEMVDGGQLERVKVRNIDVKDGVMCPVFVRHGTRRSPAPSIPGGVSFLRDVLVENVRWTSDAAAAAARLPISVTGVPGHPVENVTLRNVSVPFVPAGRPGDEKLVLPENERAYPEAMMFGRYPVWGLYARHVRGLKLEAVDLRMVADGDPRPKTSFLDCEQVSHGTLCASVAFGGLVEHIDPFIGTQGTGHTTPAAAYPFGFLQPGPDTGWNDWAHCSGYQFADTNLLGFSQTHLSGTGCPDLGDMRLVPMTGEARRERYALRMDKASERASAGYYAVRLPDEGLLVETTVAPKAAMYRITPEKDGVVHLLVDQEGRIGDFSEWRPVTMPEGFIRADGDRAFDAYFRRHGWVTERTVYSRFEFSHPFAVAFDLPCVDRKNGVVRRVLDFNLRKGEPLVVRLAFSTSLNAAARANLDRDLRGRSFDEVRAAAVAAWEGVCARVSAEGTPDQLKAFYTSLYHLFFQPNEISDYGEKPFYSTLSCWDTFRASHPLYTILCPEKIPGYVESILEQGRRTGFLPIWTLWGTDNQCMIGVHSIPVLVDAYLKGFAGDWEEAWRQIRDTQTVRHPIRYKEDWKTYDAFGYFPYDLVPLEGVSRTFEVCFDDFCAARLGRALGKPEADFFAKRAQNWKNVWRDDIGFPCGRDSKGAWRPNYDPSQLGHEVATKDRGCDFTEGNGWQYMWHVMQDPEGLIARLGGKEAFVKKLDGLFRAKVDPNAKKISDVTGLIGQYAHGNEPSHHVAYFYQYADRPDRTAEVVREVFDRFYGTTPDGLCGNDDCGQMSAWYVFSAMGFYPFNPCGGEYVIGAPQLPKVTLRLPNRTIEQSEQSNNFTIIARNLSKDRKCVKSVTLNGKPLKDFIIRHEQIMSGGELVFEF